MMALLSSGQERLFYSFNIEDHTPANHVLHSIDRCLNVKDLRHYLVEFIARPGLHLMTASFLPKPNSWCRLRNQCRLKALKTRLT